MTALQEFYVNLGGEHWTWREGGQQWDFSYVITVNNELVYLHDPCLEAWQGVICSCNNTHRFTPETQYYFEDDEAQSTTVCSVLMLFLSNYNLRGALPLHALSNLTSLIRLNVPNNDIASPLQSLCSISSANLTHLVLDNNQFSGTIPSCLLRFTALESLSCAINRVTGTLPSFLGQMLSLRRLNFKGSSLPSGQLHGTLPSSLVSLTNLASLTLFRNSFTSPLPGWLGEMRSLQYLDLGACSLYSTIPTTLGQLDKVIRKNARTSTITRHRHHKPQN